VVGAVSDAAEFRGYGDPLYAASLSAVGEPVRLPRAGGFYLRRAIPGSGLLDGMSPYPQMACDDWAALPTDLAEMRGELVSFSAVTDPFGGWNEAILREAFPDRLLLFKEHFFVDLETPLPRIVSEHHRRAARKALASLEVEELANPPAWHETWCRLYDTLIARHGITGIPAFSAEAFTVQLRIPGLRAFAARLDGTVVGMVLWLQRGAVRYYHLGAYAAEGYDHRASYGIFHESLRRFQEEGVRWVSLGSGAGLRADTTDGLSRFKRGWASGVRPVWFGGRILDPVGYAALTGAAGAAAAPYFPAYRAGEFRGATECNQDG